MRCAGPVPVLFRRKGLHCGPGGRQPGPVRAPPPTCACMPLSSHSASSPPESACNGKPCILFERASEACSWPRTLLSSLRAESFLPNDVLLLHCRYNSTLVAAGVPAYQAAIYQTATYGSNSPPYFLAMQPVSPILIFLACQCSVLQLCALECGERCNPLQETNLLSLPTPPPCISASVC